MKTKVLITGVAGLIGSRLASWILDNVKDVEVFGVDDLSGGYIENVDSRVVFHRMSCMVLWRSTENLHLHSTRLCEGRPSILMELQRLRASKILKSQVSSTVWIGVSSAHTTSTEEIKISGTSIEMFSEFGCTSI